MGKRCQFIFWGFFVERVVFDGSYRLKDLLERVNWGEVAFDTETTDLKQDRLEITGLSICDGNLNIYIPIKDEFREPYMNIIKYYFNCKLKKTIAHNIVFDMRVMSKYGVIWKNQKLFCSLVAHHLLDETSPHGLKYLTRNILGREVNDYDDKLSHYSKEFYQYALDDSYNTWLLYQHFLPQLLGTKLERLFFNIEMPFQFVLLEMALEGVTIDVKELHSMTEKVLEAEQEFTTQLLDFTNTKYNIQLPIFPNDPIKILSPVNFNSPKQLNDYLFNKVGLKPCGQKTKTGSDKTGKELIEFYKTGKNEDGTTAYSHPFIPIYSKFKIASKIYSMYKKMPDFIESDGKIRPSFKDTGTRTGRLSCSEPNLQQLPKVKADFPVKVRKVFVAPPGYKMFSCDYSGQEVAVMAQQSKDPTLVKSLNNGYDMHLAVANSFYKLGIPEEALSKDNSEYDKYLEMYKKERSQAKTITFGLAYGKGAYGFAQDFGVSEEEAQEMVDNYFKGMDKLKESINEAHEEVEKYGVVTHMYGRTRHFNLDENSEWWVVEKAKRQSFNFKIQGFSADMIRAASVNVHRRKDNMSHWDLKAVMSIHDEFVYIVREEYVDEAADFVKKSFEDICKNFCIPVNADVSIGDNYDEAK